MTEKNQQKGVLGIVRNSTNDGCLLLPLFEEGKKKELVRGYGNTLRPLLPHMLEMVSGKVEDNETFVAAMRRELLQERGLEGVSLSGPLNQALEVHQVREGEVVDFSVVLFLLSLTPDQQATLVHRDQAIEYSDTHLAASLGMMAEEPFRPLAWAALQITANNNYWK